MKNKMINKIKLIITIAIMIVCVLTTTLGCATKENPKQNLEYTTYGNYCYGTIIGEGVDFKLWHDENVMHLEVYTTEPYYICITENETNVLCNRFYDYGFTNTYEYFYDSNKFYEINLWKEEL